MKTKRILLLDGHPADRSLSQLFTDTYAASALENGHEVRVHKLSEMSFDMDFGDGGYRHSKPLETELQTFSNDLSWSDHVVVAAPMWWGSLPAKLKGLFDRTLLPGFAFDTRSKTSIGLPAPLLTGKTGHVLITADTPGWALRMLYRRAIIWQIRGQILHFVGIKPVKISWFAGATEATEDRISRWSSAVRNFGATAM